jgi:hypothetical protein
VTKQDFTEFDITEVEPGRSTAEASVSPDEGLSEVGPINLATGEAERSEAELSPPTKQVPFFSRKDYSPSYELMREQPHHRAICILLAQGLTPGEVASETGFTRVTVSNVKNQPWAQKLISEIQQEQGERAVKAILSGAAAEAARAMCDMATGKLEVPAPVRFNACKETLNRLFGVAPQHIKHEQVNPDDLSSEELRKIAIGQAN